VTLCDKAYSHEIRKSLKCRVNTSTAEISDTLVPPFDQNVPKKWAKQILSVALYQRESGPKAYQGPGNVITSWSCLDEQSTEPSQVAENHNPDGIRYFKAT